MNKKKAMTNIIVSTIFRVLVLISGLIARRYLINTLGEEATGLFSLFTSIIGFLSIAELGIGTAITFSMYKPIVNGDQDTISGLYYLYRKTYRIILIIIVVVGLSITPSIPYFADGNTGTYNIYLTYVLFLSSTLITYIYAHKTSFINAHMDNYVTSIIRSSGLILESILQVIVLINFKSFNLFLTTLIISNLLQWITTSIIFKRKYILGLTKNKELTKEVKKEVTNKTKAIFMHKIGGLLVITTDSIIIGAFVSITFLGRYSNYMLIMTGMISVLSLIFTSIASVIGQSYAKSTKDEFHQQYLFVYFLNFIIALVFFLGFWAIINDLIAIIFNSEVILDKSIVFFITVTYFMNFMRQAMIIFREASGTFYYDRYKPLAEGLLNLILSLILVRFLGISGVLIGTIITNLTICMPIEPYVLYKYGFEKSIKKYQIVNYGLLVLFILTLFLFNIFKIDTISNIYLRVITNGLISVTISILIILILIIFNENIKKTIKNYFKKLK